jgi:predicted RNase H-like HicB family nuclease
MEKWTAGFEQVDGWWIGYVEELPGANAQERTLEEARASLREAVQLILEANWENARRDAP